MATKDQLRAFKDHVVWKEILEIINSRIADFREKYEDLSNTHEADIAYKAAIIELTWLCDIVDYLGEETSNA